MARPTDAELRFLARSLASVFSAMSARSSASSSSCWTLRNLARFRAAISSASSIWRLYVLIFCCSLSTRSCMRSWFLRSSSAWNCSSLMRRSPLRKFLAASPWRRCSFSSSFSSSRTFCSSFWMIFLPPLSAAASASSRRTWSSFICCSRLLRSFSCCRAWSCSARSSSASRAASTIAFLAFSSDCLASLRTSSRSAWSACISPSSFLLATDREAVLAESSFTCSCISLSSASPARLARSDCSSSWRLSSSSPCMALQRRSAEAYCSRASSRARCSSSSAPCRSLTFCWYFLRFFCASALALLAWSSAISSSLMSLSSFFLRRRASALPLASASRLACIESRARWWFLRVFSNSSSFSWIRLSISWRTWESSSWARSTLFSSCSRAASASSSAAWSSSFSISSLLRDFSSSCTLRPPSPSWSMRSFTSSWRFLFSRFTDS
uniref:Uncharacterized protein n=1 Tax=Ixodes ricinus TaxID=34613 RepID=A0A147BD09_IXORI